MIFRLVYILEATDRRIFECAHQNHALRKVLRHVISQYPGRVPGLRLGCSSTTPGEESGGNRDTPEAERM